MERGGTSPAAIPSALRELPVGRRGVLVGSAALGITSILLPGPATAASTVSLTTACSTDPTWRIVPWVAEGSTITVGETNPITVSAPVNETDTNPGHTAYNRFVFGDPGMRNLTLTFSPTVGGIEMTSLFNTDGGAITETFDVVGKAADGTVLFTESFVNSDRTELRPASGSYVPSLARIEVLFTSGGGTASGMQFRLFTC